MAGTKHSGGHNRKGSQFHVLQGTFRADRHGGHEAPDPPKGTPTPPKPLESEAQAEWDRMIARLEAARTLSIVDDAALYQYVLLFAEVEETVVKRKRLQALSTTLMQLAMKKISGDALVQTIAKIVDLEYLMGKQHTQLRQGHMAIRQYLVEFGLTPSARGRVKVPKEKPKADSNRERFFGGQHA